MFDMILDHKLPSGLSWSEATPADGFRSDSTQSWSADAGARTIVIKINWLSLAQAIAYLVGYSKCLSTVTNQPYDPGNPDAQGPYYLSRETPARLPAMPNLRCTKILSVQGRGPNKQITAYPWSGAIEYAIGAQVSVGGILYTCIDDDNEGESPPNDTFWSVGGTPSFGGAQPAISGGSVQVGTYGDYELAFLTLQFEIPKYPILEDDEMAGNATATANFDASAGSVSGTLITDGGSGYSAPPTVTFSPPGGTTATATAILTSGGPSIGVVTGLNLTNAGSGYTAAPTVTITPPPGSGVPATATATITAGGVTGLTITNGGTGYSAVPTVTFSAPVGVTATGTAVLTAGSVTGISLLIAGTGYTAQPTITISGPPAAEYLRNHFWTPEVNLETQARKGQTWYFCQPNLGQTTFPGDRLLRQPKGVIKIIGYQIHEDYVLLGKLVPSNYEHRIGTVNSRAFPQAAYPDQNVAPGTLVQRVAGTCLLMAPKITPSAMVHPAVLLGEIGANLFPRNVDVETTILVFDPPSLDPTTIDLSGKDRYGFPYNGSAKTLVRGHNLVPLVQPILPPAWNGTTAYVAGALITSGGRAYVCILGNTNQVPPNATFWADMGLAQYFTWFAGSTATTLNTIIAGLPRPNPGGVPDWKLMNLPRPVNAQLNNLVLAIQGGVVGASLLAVAYAYAATWLNNIDAQFALALVQQALTLTVGSGVQSDQQLLYPYSDLEGCWASAESLTAPP